MRRGCGNIVGGMAFSVRVFFFFRAMGVGRGDEMDEEMDIENCVNFFLFYVG